jgi:hypothetical protein
MAPCTVDEAAREMELLDDHFHLFTEKGCATAGVLYRGDPTGYRLARSSPGLLMDWGVELGFYGSAGVGY